MKLSELSPELREKVAAAKTTEEILVLAKEEGYDLSDKELEEIAGGWELFPSEAQWPFSTKEPESMRKN